MRLSFAGFKFFKGVLLAIIFPVRKVSPNVIFPSIATKDFSLFATGSSLDLSCGTPESTCSPTVSSGRPPVFSRAFHPVRHADRVREVTTGRLVALVFFGLVGPRYGIQECDGRGFEGDKR